MDTVTTVVIPALKSLSMVDLIPWLLGVYATISAIVRAIPTPPNSEIKNPVLRALDLIFNHTNIKK